MVKKSRKNTRQQLRGVKTEVPRFLEANRRYEEERAQPDHESPRARTVARKPSVGEVKRDLDQVIAKAQAGQFPRPSPGSSVHSLTTGESIGEVIDPDAPLPDGGIVHRVKILGEMADETDEEALARWPDRLRHIAGTERSERALLDSPALPASFRDLLGRVAHLTDRCIDVGARLERADPTLPASIRATLSRAAEPFLVVRETFTAMNDPASLEMEELTRRAEKVNAAGEAFCDLAVQLLAEIDPPPVPRLRVPSGWRSDAELIRWLSHHYGEPVASRYQRSHPLISLTGIQLRLAEAADDLYRTMPDVPELPFDSALYDFGHTLTATNQWIRTIMRISSIEGVERRHGCTPWIQSQRSPQPGDESIMVVEVYSLNEAPDDHWHLLAFEMSRDDWANPDYTMIPNDVVTAGHGGWTESTAVYLGRMAAAAVCYLLQTPEWMVESFDPAGRARQATHEERHPDRKPWAREGLPTVILVDPRQPPKPRGEPQGGTHASPKPHARRAHKAVLKHPRWYQYPWNEKFITDAPAHAVPPAKAVKYSSDGVCTGTDSENQLRVWCLRADGLWQEVHLREVIRKPAWVGPEGAYEAQDGRVYRVLWHENQQEKAS